MKRERVAEVIASVHTVSLDGANTVACERPTSDVSNDASEPAYDNLRQ